MPNDRNDLNTLRIQSNGCFEDGRLWYRNGNVAINMVEPLEITGNWQPQDIGPTANYNVEKI